MIKSKARTMLVEGGGALFIALFTASALAGNTLTLSHNQRLSDTTPGNGSMVITGTVVLPPPCTVNSDQQTNVEFGDVRTDLIDGVTYKKQDIPVSISCTGTPSGQLQLSLQGNVSGTINSVLQTSVAGLGIRMRTNTVDLPLNSWMNVTNGEKLTIVATPIKLVGGILTAGEFTAAATLVIQVQ